MKRCMRSSRLDRYNLFSIYLLAAAHDSGLGQSMLDAALRDESTQLWVLRGNLIELRMIR